MASYSLMLRLTPGVVIALGVAGGCELKGTQATVLSAIAANEDGGSSETPDPAQNQGTGGGGGAINSDSCPFFPFDPKRCDMSFGGPDGPPTESYFCGLGGHIKCSFPRTEYQCIRPQRVSDAMARGIGGSVVPGVYELEAFVEHGDTSHCLANSLARYQILKIDDASNGSLANGDNNHFHWPMTFRYSTSAENVAFSITCSPYDTSLVRNFPYGPFGPFETFTATNDQLTLFSHTCRYQARFRRVDL